MNECHDDVCITCGDVAIEVTVTTVDGGDASCIAQDGALHDVVIDLVAPVSAGDRLLVHAGVALQHLGRPETPNGAAGSPETTAGAVS